MVPRGRYKSLPQLLQDFPGSPGDAVSEASGVHAVAFGMHAWGPCNQCHRNCNRTLAGPQPPGVSEEWNMVMAAGAKAVYGSEYNHTNLRQRTEMRASRTHLCEANRHNYHQNKVT